MAGGGFDYGGMESLAAQLEALESRHEQFITQFLREMGLRALAKSKKRTPVDTGELRRNWQLSDVHRRGDELYITLSNPTEYAMYIEHGHITRSGTWWEGYHMAKISIAEIERELPTRYERAMRRFLAGLG